LVKPFVLKYGDLPENIDPSQTTFQGHSRSLEQVELTRIDRLPVTSY